MARQLEASWEALTHTDDILSDILIRLPTLADLGRAAAAYAVFRRVITSRHFSRRLRALHPPSLLGVHALSNTGEFRFHPVEPPHPSAAAARDLAAAADFSFSFLPALGSAGWMVRDVRDGRFLVDCDAGKGVAFTTVAVCDPLHRRYVLLPPIPPELAATVQQPQLVTGERECEVFLVPCSEEEETAAVTTAGSSELFKVMWMAQCTTNLIAFVLSSATGEWQAVASPSWRDLNPVTPFSRQWSYPALPHDGKHSLRWRNYANGCFYWLLSNFPRDCKLLVLNTRTMEFTPAESPFGVRDKEFAIVELGETNLGMFVIRDIGGSLQRNSSLETGENNVGGTWQLKAPIVPYSFEYDTLGVFDGKLFLRAREDADLAKKFGCRPVEEYGCFSVDFKTLGIHKVRGVLGDEFRCPLSWSALYTGYPPSLSPPTI